MEFGHSIDTAMSNLDSITLNGDVGAFSRAVALRRIRLFQLNLGPCEVRDVGCPFLESAS